MRPTLLTTSQAAKIINKSQRTILNYIGKGRISASKDDVGANMIDASELYRAFPESHPDAKKKHQEKVENSPGTTEVLRVKLLAEKEKNEMLIRQIESMETSFNKAFSILEHQTKALDNELEVSRKKRKKFLGIF